MRVFFPNCLAVGGVFYSCLFGFGRLRVLPFVVFVCFCFFDFLLFWFIWLLLFCFWFVLVCSWFLLVCFVCFCLNVFVCFFFMWFGGMLLFCSVFVGVFWVLSLLFLALFVFFMLSLFLSLCSENIVSLQFQSFFCLVLIQCLFYISVFGSRSLFLFSLIIV